MKNKKVIIGIIALVVINAVIIYVFGHKTGGSASNDSNYKKVEIGKNITNDYAEINFSKTVVTTEATSKETGTTLSKVDDKVYFIIIGTVTNKNTVSFNLNNLSSKLMFDDKYRYDVTIATKDSLNIDPLEKKKFIIYAVIPKNVMEVCKTYSFKFGYNEAFSNSTLEKASNKYELSGNVDQYGSADNVINFQTFSEYISNSAEQYKGLKGYSNEKSNDIISNDIIVKDGNALQFKKLEDGKSEFTIQPTFRFSYSDWDKTCKPALIIKFCTVANPENGYYIYGNTMEISSSNGSVKIEKDSTDRILIDTNKSINLFETDFEFSSLHYDLEKIKNIINGDNLKIKVMVGKSQSNDVEVTFDCDEKIKTSLKQLFELNSKIKKQY